MFTKTAASLSTLLLLSTAASAFAQVGPGDTAPEDEIIVTGQKIERSLQDTAASVAVVTSVDIEEQNILDLGDVIERTANLGVSNGSRFTIRGIDSLNVSGAGLGDLATIYIDGAALPREATLGGTLEIWDLEQIEIFRGPQSTLQGRNSLAGAIIMSTADPTYEWTGRARAIASTGNDERRIAGAIGGPLVADQVAIRLAAEYTNADGFIENPTRGDMQDSRESLMFRGQLLIEPSSSPDLSVLLAYTRDEREFGDQIIDLSTPNPFDDRQAFSNRRIGDDIDTDILSATIDYDFTDALSLTSVSTYNSVQRAFSSDGDRTPADSEFGLNSSTTDTYTQELRLQYQSEKLTGLAGVYYSDIRTDDAVFDSTLNLDLVNDIGLIGVLMSQGLDMQTAQFVASFYSEPVVINAVLDNPNEIETYALFADASYQLTDKVRLYGGFRYDTEEQEITTGNVVTRLSTLPDPSAFPATLAPVIGLVNAFVDQQVQQANAEATTARSPSFNAFLPKVGIGYDIDDERSVNFTIQRGYRSGGVGVNTARASSFEFDQEFIWNYELAFRSRWLDNRLTLNANAFYVDWTDQQVRVQLSGNVFDQETQNAGASRIYGFEIEGEYYATDDLAFYGSVGFADTRFDEFIVQASGQTLDLSGNEFFLAPKWTLAGGATWRPDGGWVANINANYASGAFTRADRAQTERNIDARFLANARIGWENDNYGVFLTANNLFDEDYILTEFTIDPLINDFTPEFAEIGDPRTFAIQLETRF
ncbi:MAG: TonB-dependent receptor [Pseudomonadota bacterium]